MKSMSKLNAEQQRQIKGGASTIFVIDRDGNSNDPGGFTHPHPD